MTVSFKKSLNLSRRFVHVNVFVTAHTQYPIYFRKGTHTGHTCIRIAALTHFDLGQSDFHCALGGSRRNITMMRLDTNTVLKNGPVKPTSSGQKCGELEWNNLNRITSLTNSHPLVTGLTKQCRNPDEP